MIPLGILAASSAGVLPSDFVRLETVLVSGSSTSEVIFSNLNSTYGSTYRHLQIRLVARGSQSGNQTLVNGQFNGDTGFNYSLHRLNSSGSTVVSAGNASQPNFYAGLVDAASGATNAFSGAVVDILDAFNTNKNTTTRAFTGNNTNPEVVIYSGAWYNTNAISSIRLFNGGGVWVAGSRFSLYGVK